MARAAVAPGLDFLMVQSACARSTTAIAPSAPAVRSGAGRFSRQVYGPGTACRSAARTVSWLTPNSHARSCNERRSDPSSSRDRCAFTELAFCRAVRAALAVLDVVGFRKDSLAPEGAKAEISRYLRETIGKMTPEELLQLEAAELAAEGRAVTTPARQELQRLHCAASWER